MSSEKNAIKDNINMFWKMYPNVSVKAFFFRVSIIVKCNNW